VKKHNTIRGISFDFASGPFELHCMSNTYTQVHLHAVMAVKFRDGLIGQNWEPRLHQYMTAILQHRGNKVLAINSVPDHLHILFGLRTVQSIADVMRIVKGESSEWINKEGFTREKFRWQEGYGAFAVMKDSIPTIGRYIDNQKEHHKKVPFRSEYIQLLEEHGIE
jgi:putative transposase